MKKRKIPSQPRTSPARECSSRILLRKGAFMGAPPFAPERSSGVSPIWYRTARKGKRTMETRNAAALASKGGRGSTEARPGARAHSVMNAAASAPAVRSQGRHSGGREDTSWKILLSGRKGKPGRASGGYGKPRAAPGRESHAGRSGRPETPGGFTLNVS